MLVFSNIAKTGLKPKNLYSLNALYRQSNLAKIMIELGSKIKLEGFHNLEPAKFIVIKKIVGNFVNSLDTKGSPVKLLNLELINETNFLIKAKLEFNNTVVNSELTDDNLFFALNGALNRLIK